MGNSVWNLSRATRLLTLMAALLVLPSTALAQGSSDDGAKKKTIQGPGAFSEADFERSLLQAQRAVLSRKSKIRQNKRKMLEKLVRSNKPSAQKASYLFRLAETEREEAQYQYLLLREKYDEAYDCFDEGRCTEKPKEPREDYSVAFGYYRRILREHPAFRRIDEVYYHLGKDALRAGKAKRDIQLQKEGVQRLQDLVQKYPRSRYIAETHLALGEYYFETDSLFYAKTNYEKIIHNFAKSPMYNYALYKLGWVYFNLTEFEKTIEVFHKVIAAIGKGAVRARVEFRSQALNDLIVAYAEVDNGWQDARTYFLREVGEADTYVKLEKMASLLVSKEKADEAVALYRHLIGHTPMETKVLEFFSAIDEVYRSLGDETALEALINQYVDYFDPRDKWYAANKSDTKSIKAADEMRATGLQYLANRYHRAAQKLEKQRKKTGLAENYASAAVYYDKFLQRFPEHKDAYLFNFYYAEILYDQVKDYENAAKQYELVIQRAKRGEFMEDAALGVIYSIESLLVDQGLKEAGKKEVEYVSKKERTTDLRDAQLKPIPRTDLHSLEVRYVSAADTYVSLIKEALADPEFRKKKKNKNRGKMIPNIMFIAAQTFYKHGQFAEAVNRLMVIFDLYPKHKMANIAVNTIIDAYARLKHWDKIETWARKLIKERNFKVKTKAELEQMIAIALTEHARDLTKARRFDEAVVVQERLVGEFGKKNKKLAATGLFNIGVIHESARRFSKAVEAYSQVIKRYPKEDVAVQAQYDIGVLFENQTEFEKAAEAFIQMKRFKTHDQASDAIRNAALIYEALEKYREAYKTFQLYLKTFKDEEDVALVAFHCGEVLERAGDAKSLVDAAKTYTKVAKKHGKKDLQYKLRATAAAAAAYKKANKVKNRRKSIKLFEEALKLWKRVNKLDENGKPKEKIAESTKAYAALCSLELAEYTYDDYAKLKIKALTKKGKFSVRLLKKTLLAKAEALQEAEKAFDVVLEFQDPGMAAAAAFRMGQLLYEFAESLFNAEAPPELNEDQVDEYRYQLEEVAAPIQEKALAAFTLALKQALNKNVYNKWSRLSAEFAAKVNPDEFPISNFRVRPDKTKDTLTSQSFIKVLRRGDTVVDFTKERGEQQGNEKKKGEDKKGEPSTNTEASK